MLVSLLQKDSAHHFLCMNFWIKLALLSFCFFWPSHTRLPCFMILNLGIERMKLDSIIKLQQFKNKHKLYLKEFMSTNTFNMCNYFKGQQARNKGECDITEKCTIWKLYDHTMYRLYFTLPLTYHQTQFIYIPSICRCPEALTFRLCN